MSKKSFVLHEDFERFLSKDNFVKAKNKYFEWVNDKPYSMSDTKSIYDLIKNIKRSPEVIGPYQNISVFEALNRIGTDLVLLEGAERLFDGIIEGIEPKEIHLNMGNKHGLDFTVKLADDTEIFGEAFNAAPSFCLHKYRQAIATLSKQEDCLKKTKTAIMFINADVEDVVTKYKNKNEAQLKNEGVVIHKVYCSMG